MNVMGREEFCFRWLPALSENVTLLWEQWCDRLEVARWDKTGRELHSREQQREKHGKIPRGRSARNRRKKQKKRQNKILTVKREKGMKNILEMQFQSSKWQMAVMGEMVACGKLWLVFWRQWCSTYMRNMLYILYMYCTHTYIYFTLNTIREA